MCRSMSSESEVDSRNSSNHNISSLSIGSVSHSSGSGGVMEQQQQTLQEQMDTIDEKLKRTSKFLHEIQALSPVCEEPLHEDIKEKQVSKTYTVIGKKSLKNILLGNQ